jgi:8-oxo-dGTP pyrophosphatase MutT (NUDIX family)
MTEISVLYVDLYVLRPASPGWDVLCLRRGGGGRCPGAWETIHGHIQEGESPVDAALRELAEETGLVPERLYSASRVETFYLHGRDAVALIPVFCAFVRAGAEPVLSPEHVEAVWLAPPEAAVRFAWPRESRALDDVLRLLGSGGAGPLEDVLRVR